MEYGIKMLGYTIPDIDGPNFVHYYQDEVHNHLTFVFDSMVFNSVVNNIFEINNTSTEIIKMKKVTSVLSFCVTT